MQSEERLEIIKDNKKLQTARHHSQEEATKLSTLLSNVDCKMALGILGGDVGDVIPWVPV